MQQTEERGHDGNNDAPVEKGRQFSNVDILDDVVGAVFGRCGCFFFYLLFLSYQTK